MTRNLAGKGAFGRKLPWTTIGTLAVTGFGVVCSALVRASLAAADWEKAAGEKMSFDVASVKQNIGARGSFFDNRM